MSILLEPRIYVMSQFEGSNIFRFQFSREKYMSMIDASNSAHAFAWEIYEDEKVRIHMFFYRQLDFPSEPGVERNFGK